MPEIGDHKVFLSYSHFDKKWLERLIKHLKPYTEVAIAPWADEHIEPGQEWLTEIRKAIAQTKTAVLLVTPDFLASDFIMTQELPLFIAAAERGDVKILWIPIAPSAYERTAIAKYQALRKPSPALAELATEAEQDAALVEICKRINDAVNPPQQIKASKPAPAIAAAPAVTGGVWVVAGPQPPPIPSDPRPAPSKIKSAIPVEDAEDDIDVNSEGAPQQVNKLATASMSLGIASLVVSVISFCCLGVFIAPIAAVGGIAAIICGIMGKTPGSENQAITGICCGSAALVLAPISFILSLSFLAFNLGSFNAR